MEVDDDDDVEVMVEEEIQVEYVLATADEVNSAYLALSNEELAKLKRYASLRNFYPEPGYTGEDLLVDVLMQFISLNRKWPKDRIPFFLALWNAIRSVSSNRARHIKSEAGDFEFKLTQIEQGKNNEVEHKISDENASNEFLVDIRFNMKKITEYFKDDKDVLELIECIGSDLSGPDIKSYMGIDQKQFETIRRRLDRGIAKIKKELGYE